MVMKEKDFLKKDINFIFNVGRDNRISLHECIEEASTVLSQLFSNKIDSMCTASVKDGKINARTERNTPESLEMFITKYEELKKIHIDKETIVLTIYFESVDNIEQYIPDLLKLKNMLRENDFIILISEKLHIELATFSNKIYKLVEGEITTWVDKRDMLVQCMPTIIHDRELINKYMGDENKMNYKNELDKLVKGGVNYIGGDAVRQCMFEGEDKILYTVGGKNLYYKYAVIEIKTLSELLSLYKSLEKSSNKHTYIIIDLNGKLDELCAGCIEVLNKFKNELTPEYSLVILNEGDIDIATDSIINIANRTFINDADKLTLKVKSVTFGFNDFDGDELDVASEYASRCNNTFKKVEEAIDLILSIPDNIFACYDGIFDIEADLIGFGMPYLSGTVLPSTLGFGMLEIPAPKTSGEAKEIANKCKFDTELIFNQRQRMHKTCYDRMLEHFLRNRGSRKFLLKDLCDTSDDKRIDFEVLAGESPIKYDPICRAKELFNMIVPVNRIDSACNFELKFLKQRNPTLSMEPQFIRISPETYGITRMDVCKKHFNPTAFMYSAKHMIETVPFEPSIFADEINYISDNSKNVGVHDEGIFGMYNDIYDKYTLVLHGDINNSSDDEINYISNLSIKYGQRSNWEHFTELLSLDEIMSIIKVHYKYTKKIYNKLILALDVTNCISNKEFVNKIDEISRMVMADAECTIILTDRENHTLLKELAFNIFHYNDEQGLFRFLCDKKPDSYMVDCDTFKAIACDEFDGSFIGNPKTLLMSEKGLDHDAFLGEGIFDSENNCSDARKLMFESWFDMVQSPYRSLFELERVHEEKTKEKEKNLEDKDDLFKRLKAYEKYGIGLMDKMIGALGIPLDYVNDGKEEEIKKSNDRLRSAEFAAMVRYQMLKLGSVDLAIDKIAKKRKEDILDPYFKAMGVKIEFKEEGLPNLEKGRVYSYRIELSENDDYSKFTKIINMLIERLDSKYDIKISNPNTLQVTNTVDGINLNVVNDFYYGGAININKFKCNMLNSESIGIFIYCQKSSTDNCNTFEASDMLCNVSYVDRDTLKFDVIKNR